jgi:protein-S-isoprenylcysteine O-methyltransferase Ste14
MNVFEIYPFASFLVFILLISGKIFVLKKKGISVNSGSAKKKTNLVFLYPIFLLILFLWLFQIAKPAFQITLSILPETFTNLIIDSVFVKVAGIFVIALSLVFLALSLLHFKNSLRFGLNEKQAGKLITSGFFSISRNPFFLSLDLYFLGIAMLLPNLFFIGFAVLAIVSIHFFILKEEKFMVKVYGEEYEKYTNKVRRYF